VFLRCAYVEACKACERLTKAVRLRFREKTWPTKQCATLEGRSDRKIPALQQGPKETALESGPVSLALWH
jgi:hypothetical protein